MDFLELEDNIMQMARASIELIGYPKIDKIEFQLAESTLLNTIEYFKSKMKAKRDNVL